MQEALHAYLTIDDQLLLFGSAHIWALIISMCAIIGIPIFSRAKLSVQNQQRLGKQIGWIIFSCYPIATTLAFLGNTITTKEFLPLQLCACASLLTPIVMYRKSNIISNVVFFWSLSGVLQASITPKIEMTFPHFDYFRYWTGHMGIILVSVYAVVVYGFRPSFKGIWQALIAINILFVFAATANLLFDANYLYVCHKPNVKSLLDFMGPWPWYILAGEFVALIHFLAAYLGYKIILRQTANFPKFTLKKPLTP